MTNYYVRTDGSDSNDGSANDSAHAWLTIQKAVTTLQAGAGGHTVWVADGTYTEYSSSGYVAYISNSGSRNASNYLTFKSTNKWGAVLDGGDYYCKHAWIINANYVKIDGFKHQQFGGLTSSQGCDAFTGTSSSYVEIVNNLVDDMGRYSSEEPYSLGASYFDSCSYYTIHKNYFSNLGRTGGSIVNSDHALYADGCSNFIIKNNIFRDIARGWMLHLYPDPCSNIKYLNNTSVRGITARDGHVTFDCNLTDCEFSNNISYDPVAAFIRNNTGTRSNILVKNNLTYAGITVTSETGLTLSGNIENTDPLFTAYGSNDFTLTGSSPAKDAGLTLGDVTDDYVGASRPQGSVYDIGAYEYVSTTQITVGDSIDDEWVLE